MFRKVKIIATIGPATANTGALARLIDAGVNVFRVNFSHLNKAQAVGLVKMIRSAERTSGKTVSIMGDLGGPKIRIGSVAPGVVLNNGDTIKIVADQIAGSKDMISINYPLLLQKLQKGMAIHIGDGAIRLEVEKKFDGGVITRVTAGGALESRKGFSVEGIDPTKFSLSKKDKDDIQTAVETGMDALAISFVQTDKDIALVRKYLPKENAPMLIAKIETAAGVQNAKEILDAADGMMIARGDLGFSMPMEELPYIQKRLIQLALRKAKPIITATQMLESMIYNHLPTRAEVSDVAKAVLDGTDCVMLSGETAVGKFPEETVRMMGKIIDAAVPRVAERHFPDEDMIADAVSASAVSMASQIGAKLICVFTQSGSTAKRVARYRPLQPILALSSNRRISYRLNFSWGVYPVIIRAIRNTDQMIEEGKKAAQNNGVINLSAGDPFVISAGIPFGKSGTTNLVLVERV
jgi:pyruvate kinase